MIIECKCGWKFDREARKDCPGCGRIYATEVEYLQNQNRLLVMQLKKWQEAFRNGGRQTSLADWNFGLKKCCEETTEAIKLGTMKYGEQG
jgi:hypothetical protein